MSFASPLWLLALAAIPLALLAQLAARRRARRYAIRFPAVASARAAAAAVGGPASWRRRFAPLCALLCVTALALALAGPRIGERVPSGQADVMLVIDHSGSMAASDVYPTRIQAAIAAANTLIDQLPKTIRVGAIGFGTVPDAVQAPAADHAAARTLVDSQTPNGSTATGNALALALDLLHAGLPHHPPAAIVLLSDGSANAGQNVITVAQASARDHVPIDTVALGTPNGELPNPDPFAPPVPVPPDPQLMGQIAHASGGRTFNAQSAVQLSSIYRHLGLELGTVARRRSLVIEFALAGLVLLVLAGAASTRWRARLP